MGLYGPRLKLARATAYRHRHAEVLVFGSLLLALVHKDRVRRRNHCKVSQTCAGSALDRSLSGHVRGQEGVKGGAKEVREVPVRALIWLTRTSIVFIDVLVFY